MDERQRKPVWLQWAAVAVGAMIVLYLAVDLAKWGLNNLTIVLPVLAVALPAFSLWLVVRIINRRETWAKWTAVLVTMLLIGVAAIVGLGRILDYYFGAV